MGGIRSLDKQADQGATVHIGKLRKAARSQHKEIFDRSVLDAAERGLIDLHRHDFPAGLSAKEKEELIHDKHTGQYFIGAALSERAQKPLPSSTPHKKDIRGRFGPARKSQNYQHGPRNA